MSHTITDKQRDAALLLAESARKSGQPFMVLSDAADEYVVAVATTAAAAERLVAMVERHEAAVMR